MDIVWDDDNGITEAVMSLYNDGETDSDLETEDVEESQQTRWWGSCIGKLGNMEQHPAFYSHLLYNDYWGEYNH